MADRFFCPQLSGSVATLSDAEAHHAIHVMRVQPGQTVELFDGAGTVACASVDGVDRKSVRLQIESTSFEPQRDGRLLTVAACAPKGERLRWMIEKLTEIGVDRFVPLQTARSVVNPRDSKLTKLSATVIAACKQSGRRWVMEIGPPTTLNGTLETGERTGTRIYVAHPGDHSSSQPISMAQSVTIVIGPEGGFTSEEIAEAQRRRARLISWPGDILRTETAAIVTSTLAVADRIHQAG